MRQVWVMIGVGVTVAATAAVLLPTGSAPPVDEAATEEVAASRPVVVKPGSSSGSSQSAPPVQNNFAPIDRSNVPGMRERKGPLRAPEPTRTAEVRRPVNAVAGENALANSGKTQTPKPVPVTPAAATTTTTTGTGGGPRQAANRPHPSAGGAQQNAQAQLEQRRQELENARRQRLQQVRGPVGGAGGAPQRESLTPANQNNSGESANESPNGAPSLDDLIRNNPWLADYAPGGRFASNGNTTGGASNSGSNSGSNNGGSLGNSGSNSGGNSGNNSGGSTGGNAGGGGTVVGGNGGVSPTATVAGFKWLPVDNRACGATLNGFRTNDLYVRLDVAAPVLGISTEANPLTITGGSFFQATGTGDGLPTTGALAAGPCVQFDTYLNSGTSFSLIGGTTENPVFTPTAANGSLFNFAGVTGGQDPVVFGDNGFYVFFGRFTAPSTISSLTGKLSVDTGVPGTTSFRSFVVDLTFDSTVWAFNPAFGLPGAAGGGQGPGSFSLTLPASGATGVPLTTIFAWSAATGAIDYELTIDTDAAFAMPHTFRATTATTSLAIPGATLSNGTAYHWRVVARGATGTTAGTPASAMFTTLGTPPGGGPSDDDDVDTPGGETPGGTPDPCANQAPGITAVWRAIDNGACADGEFEVDLTNFATADLYVRMATTNSQSTIPPFSLQFVSAEVSGSPPMTLGNGMFFEHSSATGSAGNLRPSLVNTNAVPCLAFDTYVTIDTGLTETPASGAPGFQALPQMILPPGVSAFNAAGIRGLWVVPGFGASSALPAARDVARFPNDPCGYYVRIGRLTITRGATLSGTLLVAFVLPGAGTTTTAEVTVPNCVACWGQPAPPPPTP